MNYYEMFGLPCDGDKVHDTDIIKKALDEWKQKTDYAIANEMNRIKRDKLIAARGESAKMEMLLTGAELRTYLAQELKNARLAQIETFIVFLRKHRLPTTISSASLQSIAESFKLEFRTVRSYFEGRGYHIDNSFRYATNDFLMRESEFAEITEYFESIKEHMAKNPAEPLQEIANATNLFEYIAIMDGKTIADAKDYEAKETPALYALFREKWQCTPATMPCQSYIAALKQRHTPP